MQIAIDASGTLAQARAVKAGPPSAGVSPGELFTALFAGHGDAADPAVEEDMQTGIPGENGDEPPSPDMGDIVSESAALPGPPVVVLARTSGAGGDVETTRPGTPVLRMAARLHAMPLSAAYEAPSPPRAPVQLEPQVAGEDLDIFWASDVLAVPTSPSGIPASGNPGPERMASIGQDGRGSTPPDMAARPSIPSPHVPVQSDPLSAVARGSASPASPPDEISGAAPGGSIPRPAEPQDTRPDAPHQAPSSRSAARDETDLSSHRENQLTVLAADWNDPALPPDRSARSPARSVIAPPLKDGLPLQQTHHETVAKDPFNPGWSARGTPRTPGPTLRAASADSPAATRGAATDLLPAAGGTGRARTASASSQNGFAVQATVSSDAGRDPVRPLDLPSTQASPAASQKGTTYTGEDRPEGVGGTDSNATPVRSTGIAAALTQAHHASPPPFDRAKSRAIGNDLGFRAGEADHEAAGGVMAVGMLSPVGPHGSDLRGVADIRGLTGTGRTRVDVPAEPHRQLADAIVRTREGQVEILLDPVELGRVTITMGSDDRAGHVALMADRPETLDLIRRHSDLLLRDLRDSGMTDVRLDFQRQDHPGNGRPPHGQRGEAQADTRPRSDTEDRPRPSIASQQPARTGDTTRLDIRM